MRSVSSSIPRGTKLGPYEIVETVGVGGMGEVYRARDARLGRDVAVKVLPEDVGRDPERRARFEREARAVAALDHPHICAIYDVGEASGTDYLVMPLLDGQTLADRLSKGPLPLAEALKVAGEIADALDKAHRQGIVHRDLKPANVMLTKNGVKLLDFGLAKLRGKPSPVLLSSGAQTATTTAGTAEGMILGTIHYMAPEQVEGKNADHRADIWALGAVLYEMITGARPFQGDTAARIVGAILKDTPLLVSRKQAVTPPLLDRAVARCLEKDPDERWQSAADVRHVLLAATEESPGAAYHREQSSRRTPARWSIVAALASLVVALAMLPGWLANRAAAPPRILRMAVLPEEGTTFSSPPATVVTPQIAVSPDGTHIAFVTERQGGRPALWIRALEAGMAHPLAGTDDATYPFWAPDNKSIGFFAQGKLKVVDVAGGPPRPLADAGLDSRGGSWGRDGTIVFAPRDRGGLVRISAAGGEAVQVTEVDGSRGESSHRFPSFLPDGRRFLFAVRTLGEGQPWGIAIASVEGGTPTRLPIQTDHVAHYASSGHILFVREDTLLAQAFDADSVRPTGEPIRLVDGVGSTPTSYASFSVSQSGTLVYAARIRANGQFQWFDRTGVAREKLGEPGEYLDFELSADERTLAFSRVDDSRRATADVWLLDLARAVPTRLTTDPQNDRNVLWSPDGARLAFGSNRKGTAALFVKSSGGAVPESVFMGQTGFSLIPTDWSPDGSRLVFHSSTSPAGFDIWTWATSGQEQPALAVRSTLNATHGKLSPNGRWLAYTSDASGQPEVFVQPFPGTGEQRKISVDGGTEPRWRRDGRELVYLAANGYLMSVGIPAGDAFTATAPHQLFQVRVPQYGSPYRSHFVMSKDATRFLVNNRVDTVPPPINVILNWPLLLTEPAAK